MEKEVPIPQNINLAALEKRCNELAQYRSQDSDQQLDELCIELGIDAEALAQDLSTKCIWALFGYIEEAINPSFWD